MTKKSFINPDFLLTTRAARELYHGYAEKLPVIDYHTHLPPEEAALDIRWTDPAEIWLAHDHYKWRQMRWNGIDERFITGDAPWKEKFVRFAETMEKLVGNPLFDWTQLELKRFYGIDERLCGANALRVWAKCAKKLKERDFSAQGLLRKAKVEVVCTTDDPSSDLRYHQLLAKHPCGVKVLPTFRPDRVLAEALKTKKDPMEYLAERHRHFERHGCRLADYGPWEVPEKGPYADWLFECMKLDAKAGWAVQIHFNCWRNLNPTLWKSFGADAGADAIGCADANKALARLFARLERADAMPKTILYPLNPRDLEMTAALAGCFERGPAKGRVQLGAPWWFMDQKYGIRRVLDTVGALGALGNFVGMLSDSRSFFCATRHEYFRRLLCQKLGEEVEKGELPSDLDWLGKVVADISYYNAKDYFGF